MSEKNWKKSRDLALLALASYKGEEKPKKDKDIENADDISSVEEEIDIGFDS